MTRCVVQTIQEMDARVSLSMSVLLSCYSERMGSAGLRDANTQFSNGAVRLSAENFEPHSVSNWYEEKASVANVEPVFQTFVKLTSGFIVSWF